MTVAVPADSVTDGRADEHACPECRRRVVIVGVGLGIDVGVRRWLLYDDDRRIVGRHVDNFRRGGFYLDDFVLLHDRHALVGPKVSRRIRLCPKPLDRVHQVLLLIDDRVTQSRGPVQVLVYPFDDVRVVEQSQYAAVPPLVRLELRLALALLQVARSLNDFQWIG